MAKHNLHKPVQCYNMDKSWMPLDHKQPKVVINKGIKKVYGHLAIKARLLLLSV